MGVTYGSGWATSTQTMCLDTGCFVMYMYDSGNNGWTGATLILQDALGATVQSGTLASGSSGAVAVPIGTSSPCEVPTVVTASDCPQAVNVCTNLNFTINPERASGYFMPTVDKQREATAIIRIQYFYGKKAGYIGFPVTPNMTAADLSVRFSDKLRAIDGVWITMRASH